MLILSTKGVVTLADNKTNIPISFRVPEGVDKLVVKYSYFPKTIDNRADAISLASQGLSKYGLSFVNPESVLPIRNFVAVSFDENGKYRGACHRHPNEQTIVIAKENSTPGIFNRELEAGSWQIVLNVHYVACDVDYIIEIEG